MYAPVSQEGRQRCAEQQGALGFQLSGDFTHRNDFRIASRYLLETA